MIYIRSIYIVLGVLIVSETAHSETLVSELYEDGDVHGSPQRLLGGGAIVQLQKQLPQVRVAQHTTYSLTVTCTQTVRREGEVDLNGHSTYNLIIRIPPKSAHCT